MILHQAIVTRRPDLDEDTFRRRWLDGHAALVAALPGVRRYLQHHAVQRMQVGSVPAGPHVIDGISQIWFDDEAAMTRALTSPAYAACRADLATFAARSLALTVTQHEVIPRPPLQPRGEHDPRSLLKRMSVLERAAHLTREAFHREWADVHAPLVREIPAVRGYLQDHVHDATVELAGAGGVEPPAIDGVAELWFDDLEAMYHALPPDAPASRHAATILARMTTVFVEEIRIV